MSASWLAVDLKAEWRRIPPGVSTVNVGRTVRVIAILISGGRVYKALVVRPQYMGSDHNPRIDTVTSIVDRPLDFLRIAL